MRVKLCQADRQTDGHDESNSHSLFAKSASQGTVTQIIMMMIMIMMVVMMVLKIMHSSLSYIYKDDRMIILKCGKFWIQFL